MNLVLEHEIPPLYGDETGAIRVGHSKVLLETVIRAFQDGASPESIVHRYETLSLADVYRYNCILSSASRFYRSIS